MGQPGTAVLSVCGVVNTGRKTSSEPIHPDESKPGRDPNNARHVEVASYSAFFGPKSHFNETGTLEKEDIENKTAVQALKMVELIALIRGLEIVQKDMNQVWSPFQDMKLLVVKTHSTNLYNGITLHIVSSFLFRTILRTLSTIIEEPLRINGISRLNGRGMDS